MNCADYPQIASEFVYSILPGLICGWQRAVNQLGIYLLKVVWPVTLVVSINVDLHKDYVIGVLFPHKW